jgi:hypothetical protein
VSGFGGVTVQITACNVIEIWTPGPQGIQGPQGIPGPQGPPGPGPGPGPTPSGAGNYYGSLLGASMMAGNNDYGATPIYGYLPGVTNNLQLTPNSVSGSNLVGILNPGVGGWALVISNVSTTMDITILNQAAASPGDQFNTPLGVPWVIQPQQSVYIVYVNGIGWIIVYG